MGTQKDCLTERILLSTNSIGFSEVISELLCRKDQFTPPSPLDDSKCVCQIRHTVLCEGVTPMHTARGENNKQSKSTCWSEFGYTGMIPLNPSLSENQT